MKTSLPSFRACARLFLFSLILLEGSRSFAQVPIVSINTTSYSLPTVSYLSVKGAGLRHADNTLRSNWDSTGSSFSVNYNTSLTADVTGITEFLVSGQSAYSIRMPANAIVKLRRNANSYVNDTTNHFNYWARYSTVPVDLSLLGIYNFTAPEIVNPEDAFMSNNINSGYDNIFQNTIANLHAGNIERVDFILPGGLKPVVSQDTAQGGVAVFDRGSGDPFKVAAILSVDNNNKPLTYGPLISVTAANFGSNLLGSSFNYCIITHDPKYNNQSRPSSPDNQNIRGVYISLGRLGINIGQRFYGYSLFGPDVVTASADWTTYPTNTNGSSMLDPINVMNVFATVSSVLAVPLEFNAEKKTDGALLHFTIYDKVSNQYAAIERSSDANHFTEIKRIPLVSAGVYEYADKLQAGNVYYYRVKLVGKDGATGYSEVRKIKMDSKSFVDIYPNPAKEKIWIAVPQDWQQKQLTASLLDADGKIIRQQLYEKANANNIFYLPSLKNAVYFLQLTNPYKGETVTRKLFVRL